MGFSFWDLEPMDRAAVILTVGFKLLLLIAGLIYLAEGEDVNQEIQKEDGIIENLTVVCFIGAGIIFLRSMLSDSSSVRKVFTNYRILLILLGLACIFAGLEEISFGQRIGNWDSPEYFEENSSQEETDFHNFEGLDLVFGIAAMALILYGVIIPWGFLNMPEKFIWFRRPFGIQMIYPPIQSSLFFLLGIVCIFIDAGTKYILDSQFVANEYQEYLFGFGFLLFSLYLYDPTYRSQYAKNDQIENSEHTSEILEE